LKSMSRFEQSFIELAVFGLDTQGIILKWVRKYVRLFSGCEVGGKDILNGFIAEGGKEYGAPFDPFRIGRCDFWPEI